MTKPPFFIIGNPRSGTTLLRLMLTCHPHLVVPPEAGFAVWFYDRYRDFKGDPAETTAFVRDLLKSRKFETWGLTRADLYHAIELGGPRNYSELIATVYWSYMRSRNETARRWGDKNNFHLNHICTLDHIFPGALFLHIVRDPRAVAASYRRLHRAHVQSEYAPDLPYEPCEIARTWKKNIQTIQNSFDRIGHDRAHELRFEDLLFDPEAVLSQICAFLNEVYDPAMLEYHIINREQKLEPEEMLQWKQFTLEPPRRDRVDEYRHELADADIGIIMQITSEELHHYGYVPESRT